MRILLERDDATFTTFAGPNGRCRALLVRVNGKPFFVTRSYETFREQYDPEYSKHMDEILVGCMERVMTKVFNDACGAIPEGVELLAEEK